MSAPQYPETIPWRPIGAIVLTVASFFGSVALWKRQAPLLERVVPHKLRSSELRSDTGFLFVYRLSLRQTLGIADG
jgi:hypothetical protein